MQTPVPLRQEGSAEKMIWDRELKGAEGPVLQRRKGKVLIRVNSRDSDLKAIVSVLRVP